MTRFAEEQGMKRLWQNLLAVLREIFDEASYARFLERQGLESSQHAYAVLRAGDYAIHAGGGAYMLRALLRYFLMPRENQIQNLAGPLEAVLRPMTR
jgi:hypothetical protein